MNFFKIIFEFLFKRHKAAKKLADEGSPGTNKLKGFKTSFPLISIKFFYLF